MVEGARLESVCRGNSTVGSNPTLSANNKINNLQRSLDLRGQWRATTVTARMPACPSTSTGGIALAARAATPLTFGQPNSTSAEGLEAVRLHHLQSQVRSAASSRRKATGTADWDGARRFANTYEEAASWTAIHRRPSSHLLTDAAADHHRGRLEHLPRESRSAVAPATSASTRRSRSNSRLRGFAGLCDARPVPAWRHRCLLHEQQARTSLEGQDARSASRASSVCRESRLDSEVAGEPRPQTADRLSTGGNKMPFTDEQLATSSKPATSSRTSGGGIDTAPAIGPAKISRTSSG